MDPLAATERKLTATLPIKMTQPSPGRGITADLAWQPRKFNKGARERGAGSRSALSSGVFRPGTGPEKMLSLWRPDPGANGDAYLGLTSPGQGKRRKKEMVLEQFGQENNRILYFLAQE